MSTRYLSPLLLALLLGASHPTPTVVLLKQTDLPQAEVRSACLNLLPQITDRLPQFEKSFGPLSALERHRIQALAAEARGEWSKAEWARARSYHLPRRLVVASAAIECASRSRSRAG